MSAASRRIQMPWARSDRTLPRVVVQPLQRFLDTEASGGIVLLLAAAAAIVWANSPWSSSYDTLWHTEISLHIGGAGITESLQHWVNDLAMALFFFVAGLEIKREVVHGELGSVRAATLPVACAVGGMVVPALLYLSFNTTGPGTGGWGVPMATDIAFALGVLALVGRRVPASLRVFLLTLAIVDDLGAILVIAIFYSTSISMTWLAGAAVATIAIVVLQRLHVRSLLPYIALAAVLWLTVFESGVHATLAGVMVGLLTPAHPFQRARDVKTLAVEQLADPALADDVTDETDEAVFLEVAALSREAISPLARLERSLHPWSSFVVLPLFALANAGIALNSDTLSAAVSSQVTHGVVVGLLIGKPVGVLLAAFLVVKLARGSLPRGAGWVELAGIGMLAGIGFTVSLFITGLAFTGPEVDDAKIGILFASITAGVAGAVILLARPTTDPLTTEADEPIRAEADAS